MNKKLTTLLALAFLGLHGLSTAAESVIIAKVGDTEVKAEDIKPLLAVSYTHLTLPTKRIV